MVKFVKTLEKGATIEQVTVTEFKGHWIINIPQGDKKTAVGKGLNFWKAALENLDGIREAIRQCEEKGNP